MQATLTQLTTPRLLLRPFTWDDLPVLIAEHADPAVTQYLMLNTPWTEATAQAWLADLLSHYGTEGIGHYAVVRTSDGVLVGRCGLSSWIIEGDIELGYTFWRSHWGQGYATEAARAMRDYAFLTLPLHRLISFIQTGNLPSTRVAERNGFALEKTIPRHDRTWMIWTQSRAVWEDNRLREAEAVHALDH